MKTEFVIDDHQFPEFEQRWEFDDLDVIPSLGHTVCIPGDEVVSHPLHDEVTAVFAVVEEIRWFIDEDEPRILVWDHLDGEPFMENPSCQQLPLDSTIPATSNFLQSLEADMVVAAPSYLEVLNFLVTLGPKAAQALQIIQQFFMPGIAALIAIFKPAAPAGAPVVGHLAFEPNPEEAQAETRLMACIPHDHPHLVGAGGALGFLAMVRQIYQLISANPALWAMVVSLIKQYLPTAGAVQG